jgi:hypothetical protein
VPILRALDPRVGRTTSDNSIADDRAAWIEAPYALLGYAGDVREITVNPNPPQFVEP